MSLCATNKTIGRHFAACDVAQSVDLSHFLPPELGRRRPARPQGPLSAARAAAPRPTAGPLLSPARATAPRPTAGPPLSPARVEALRPGRRALLTRAVPPGSGSGIRDWVGEGAPEGCAAVARSARGRSAARFSPGTSGSPAEWLPLLFDGAYGAGPFRAFLSRPTIGAMAGWRQKLWGWSPMF